MNKMKIDLCVVVFVTLWICSCSDSFDATKNLDSEMYNGYLKQLSPYVIRKPDEISYQDRFAKRVESYYQNILSQTEGKLQYYNKKDTAQFFFYCYKDLSSLFEHYRGLGGYFKTDNNDSIIFVNLLYHTPRLTKDEINERGEVLFSEMISKGSVSKYIGNRDFIHTPNNDFYYNVKENRWDYTENSSWKFLQEERRHYETER